MAAPARAAAPTLAKGKGIGGGREGNGGSSSELHLGSVSRQIVVAERGARSRVGSTSVNFSVVCLHRFGNFKDFLNLL
eukprot:scaffold46153_cov117-Skeletonema_marinoi.AAC.1